MANANDLLGMLPGWFTVAEVRDLPMDNSTFTITTAGIMAVGRDKDEKPVLTFANTGKGLVLNKNRARQLKALFGDAELVGKKIRLAVENIDSREQIVVLSAND